MLTDNKIAHMIFDNLGSYGFQASNPFYSK